MLTTAARSLASWPSGSSGWRRYSAAVTTRPSTESPRNSSRSLVGRPPFSYAYERWVRAWNSNPGSTVTSSDFISSSGSGTAPFGIALTRCPANVAARTIALLPARSEVLDLAPLVLQVERGTSGIGDDPGLVRPRVGHVATGHRGGERRRRRLPLRPAGPRVTAGHLPLRNSHAYFSFSSSRPPSAAAGPGTPSARMPSSADHRGSAVSCVCPGWSARCTPHSEHNPGQSS